MNTFLSEMNTFLTAVAFVIVILMASALYVLIWDILDKKHLVNLEEEVYQQVITFLNNEDKSNITTLINEATLNLSKG